MLWIRRRLVLRAIAVLGLAWAMGNGSFVNAQGGGIGGGGGAGGGTGAGGGAGGGSGIGGGGAGGAGGGFGGGGMTGAGGGFTGGGGQTTTGGARGGTGTSGGGLNQSNFLRDYYSNPMYMGRYSAPVAIGANSSSSSSSGGGAGGAGGAGGTSSTGGQAYTPNAIGGFGQPSLGTSSGTSQSGGGRLGGTAGVSTNAGRNQGQNSSQNQNQNATRVLYSATLKFTPTPKPASEFEADLRDMLGRSSSLTNPAGIELSVADRVVTIRGKVANDDERRLAEGLLRLAPGVREVRNELETQ
jgi:BON domain